MLTCLLDGCNQRKDVTDRESSGLAWHASSRRCLCHETTLLLSRINSEVCFVVLLRLRFQHELAADAAALPVSQIRLRCLFSQLSVWHHPPFPPTRLRHCQCFSDRPARSLGDCL